MKQLRLIILLVAVSALGCAHFPVNRPLAKFNPESGYRAKNMTNPGSSDDLFLILTFSGGGTRAGAFSYGVLEELRDTEVVIDGRKRKLLDEVDVISSVSGGSFTAAYYGLFGDRMFEDYEGRFLKKNINGALIRRILLNPYNWIRLLSPRYDRSDLAAEYYDNYIFEHRTFKDIAENNGPFIMINTTDMVTGLRIAFTQDAFDVICSDVSHFPVARAVAASSAVPILFTPITLKNYTNSCGFKLPGKLQEVFEERDASKRGFYFVNNIEPYLDADKTKYIHLVDGGVSDNLGLRAALDRVAAFGNLWDSVKGSKHEGAHKVVFIVVNAETEVSSKWKLFDRPPSFSAMLKSYSSTAITRYNFETVMLLRESFTRWTEEIQRGRCGDGPVSTEPGACGDIRFYVVEVKFDALKDEDDRTYFKQLPTSFKLPSDVVDSLKASARKILRQSPEYQMMLNDLKQGPEYKYRLP